MCTAGRDGLGRPRFAVVQSAEEDGESAVGAAGAGFEVVDSVDAVLGGCGDDAGDDTLGACSVSDAVPAPGFSVHDAGSGGLLAPDVGGVAPSDSQEREESIGLVG